MLQDTLYIPIAWARKQSLTWGSFFSSIRFRSFDIYFKKIHNHSVIIVNIRAWGIKVPALVLSHACTNSPGVHLSVHWSLQKKLFFFLSFKLNFQISQRLELQLRRYLQNHTHICFLLDFLCFCISPQLFPSKRFPSWLITWSSWKLNTNMSEYNGQKG